MWNNQSPSDRRHSIFGADRYVRPAARGDGDLHADECPAVSSLFAADQKFIENSGGRVPPLAGKSLLERWGSKTASQLGARSQEAKFSFEEAGLTDDEGIVQITAYVLQVNGAKAGNQPLTRSTHTIVSSERLRPFGKPGGYFGAGSTGQLPS